MMNYFLGVVTGLIVGWVLIPTPQWVSNLYAKWFGK